MFMIRRNRHRVLEAVVQRCSVKKVFLEISQNSPESTCARVSFLIKLQARSATLLKKRPWRRCFFCEFCEISKNTFSYRTHPVAASGLSHQDCVIKYHKRCLLNLTGTLAIARVPQPTFTCSKPIMETLKLCVESVQS